MDRVEAEGIMDAVESNRPWHERIPARLGTDPKQRLGSEDGTAAGATHYQMGDKQPIEIMQEVMTTEEFFGYLRGNVIKYSLRMGHKDNKAKDAQKAAQYSKWLAQALGGKTIDPREG